jgi:reactive intermediate/imine deaminase
MRWLVPVLFLSLAACAAPPATVEVGSAPVFLNSDAVLPANLPFSEAVRVGGTLYLSGMIGIVPHSMELVPGGIEAESKQTLDNIRRVLVTYGYDIDDIVKCTVMLADIAEWETFNEIYKTFFNQRYPARSAMGVNGLALDARVEVECIAVKADVE